MTRLAGRAIYSELTFFALSINNTKPGSAPGFGSVRSWRMRWLLGAEFSQARALLQQCVASTREIPVTVEIADGSTS